MTDQFFIRYDVSTKWENGVHYILAAPLEHVEALLPLLNQLIRSQDEPNRDNICPICGQIFQVNFYTAPLTVEPLTISTYCKICNIYNFFRSNQIPWWAKEAPLNEWLEELRKPGDNNA